MQPLEQLTAQRGALVWGQFILHLEDDHAAVLFGKIGRGFAADQPAADYGGIPAGVHLLLQHIPGGDGMPGIDAGQDGNYRHRPRGQDHGVRFFAHDVIFGGGAVHADIHIERLDTVDQVAQDLSKAVFMRRLPGQASLSPQFAGALEEDHPVPPFPGDAGRLQPSRAPADNDHLAAAAGLDKGEVKLLAGPGIVDTADRLIVNQQRVDAELVAFDAFADVFDLAELDLPGEMRIGDQRPAE